MTDRVQLRKLIRAIQSALTSRTRAKLPPEMQEIPEAVELLETIATLRKFTASLAGGDLTPTLQVKGELASALKKLQANQRQLTRQTQRIASGDLTQRADSKGKLSQALNSIVEQLAQSRTELRALEERLAVTDPLTGAFNRRHFEARALEELERANRYERPLALVMIDIDHFRQINDAHGNAVGDRVLQALAELCRKSLRGNDIIGRYGGEELVILLPETQIIDPSIPAEQLPAMAAPMDAQAVAERLRQAIGQMAVETDRGKIHITISLGIAGLGEPPREPNGAPQAREQQLHQLIARAELALYAAKESGRNCVRVFTQPSAVH
jgi:diguanylate cyclase (GGDEF)-like protein